MIMAGVVMYIRRPMDRANGPGHSDRANSRNARDRDCAHARNPNAAQQLNTQTDYECTIP